MEVQFGDPRVAIQLESGSVPAPATLIGSIVASAAEALELGRRFAGGLKIQRVAVVA